MCVCTVHVHVYTQQHTQLKYNCICTKVPVFCQVCDKPHELAHNDLLQISKQSFQEHLRVHASTH